MTAVAKTRCDYLFRLCSSLQYFSLTVDRTYVRAHFQVVGVIRGLQFKCLLHGFCRTTELMCFFDNNQLLVLIWKHSQWFCHHHHHSLLFSKLTAANATVVFILID